MTAAQKKNIERFKKAAAEAKKLRKKNPKLTQTEAIKEAFRIIYKKGKVGDYQINKTEFNETRLPIMPRKKRNKKKKTYAVAREYDGTFKKITRISGVKKPARKKATAKSYHKDTKSHNVRISVVSGLTVGQSKLLKNWQHIYGQLAQKYVSALSVKDRKYITKEMQKVKKIISDIKKLK